MCICDLFNVGAKVAECEEALKVECLHLAMSGVETKVRAERF